MLGRHSRTGRDIYDGVSGARARVHQKKKCHLQRSTVTMGGRKAWRMLTALLKQLEVSNKPWASRVPGQWLVLPQASAEAQQGGKQTHLTFSFSLFPTKVVPRAESSAQQETWQQSLLLQGKWFPSTAEKTLSAQKRKPLATSKAPGCKLRPSRWAHQENINNKRCPHSRPHAPTPSAVSALHCLWLW